MTRSNHALFGPPARLIAVGTVLLMLAGCATPADPERMIVTTPTGAPGFPASLRNAMCVRNITGGDETNPLWVSEVGNAEFSKALTNSLSDARLLASPNACRYFIDVDLLGLSQPVAGFSMTVTSHANYKVYSGGKPVLLATINADYTAEFSESVLGVERLKRANEGSIRTSITQFLDRLRTFK